MIKVVLFLKTGRCEAWKQGNIKCFCCVHSYLQFRQILQSSFSRQPGHFPQYDRFFVWYFGFLGSLAPLGSSCGLVRFLPWPEYGEREWYAESLSSHLDTFCVYASWGVDWYLPPILRNGLPDFGRYAFSFKEWEPSELIVPICWITYNPWNAIQNIDR